MQRAAPSQCTNPGAACVCRRDTHTTGAIADRAFSQHGAGAGLPLPPCGRTGCAPGCAVIGAASVAFGADPRAPCWAAILPATARPSLLGSCKAGPARPHRSSSLARWGLPPCARPAGHCPPVCHRAAHIHLQGHASPLHPPPPGLGVGPSMHEARCAAQRQRLRAERTGSVCRAWALPKRITAPSYGKLRRFTA